MKLSAWHKKQGDTVYIMHDKTISTRLIPFDKVYISCIFEENAETAKAIAKQFKSSELGGIGVNNRQLPDHIEHIKPDYEGFNWDYSMGYTTRGCIRSCSFCKVSTHEGNIRANADIYEFWDTRHKHLVLLDNNILGLPKHFEHIAEQIIKEGLTVDFNQGLDIRLLTDRNAAILNKLSVTPVYRFAFDTMACEKAIIRGVKLLNKHDIKRATFYVLVGYDTTIEQDLYRLELLKKLGQRAYVMRYNKKPKYINLAAWANQPAFFMTTEYEQFKDMRENRKPARALYRHAWE